MKLKLIFTWVAVTFGLLFFISAVSIRSSAIKGTVSPAAAASEVLAWSGADTLRASPVNGVFSIKNVKAGSYTVLIVAVPPYNNVEKAGVNVMEEEQTDLGEIKLTK